MFALALLLVVDPPPASFRWEVRETVTVGDAAPTVTTESVEAAVAADGTFSARVVDGARTRTLSGKVWKSSDHWLFQVGYREVVVDGWIAVPGGRKPFESVTEHDTFLSIDALGKPVVIDGIITSSKPEDGPGERRVRSYASTLLPAFGAPATHEPAVVQGLFKMVDPAP
ncbi:hypothetical protein [Alienimonas californiensis]|uniref:Uncharacterized protein n=1 Tax=Alienimonas californiensis TaxID=2527989 RepID=A0A517P420_9PLAN|nr:hypothetical protein [Alienimonas californiensis]QDT14119.1 hypothetical protein CA12_01870 [Alienimonas californiensis]